ncbi:Lysine-specific histone demethylase 1 homolog 2 [Linum grandiflorum]
MLAISLGFPIDALLEEEIHAGVVKQLGGKEQNDYIVVRNHILTRWRSNVRMWLTKGQIRETVSAEYEHLLSSAYDFLLYNGYINFGILSDASLIPEVTNDLSVIIVGQLMSFGFKVIVLEGRDRPGGRVYTQKIGRDGQFAVADIGASVITGIHANPLGVLARQLSIPFTFNKLLDKVMELRQVIGGFGNDVSLGLVLGRLQQLYGDDPFEMGGDHCFLAGGNWRLITSLCQGVPIFYGRTVDSIKYSGDGVSVLVGEQVFQADMRKSIRFEPELPRRKLEAIERLGFGLLNKVAMLFPTKRGEFFLFYGNHTVSGGAVLIALVAGEAAQMFESEDPSNLLHRVLDKLRGERTI